MSFQGYKYQSLSTATTPRANLSFQHKNSSYNPEFLPLSRSNVSPGITHGNNQMNNQKKAETQLHENPQNKSYYINQSSSSPNVKLNEMSTDLAKLKQQLNSIMGQANQYGKKSNIGYNNVRQSPEKQILPNNMPTYGDKNKNQFSQGFNYKNFTESKGTRQNIFQNGQLSFNNSVRNSLTFKEEARKPQSLQTSLSDRVFKEENKLNLSNNSATKYQPQYAMQQNKSGKFDFGQHGPFYRPNLKIQPAQKPISFEKSNASDISSSNSSIYIQQIMRQKSQQSPRLEKKSSNRQEIAAQQKIIELQHEKRKLRHQINSLNLQKEDLQQTINNEKIQKTKLLKRNQQLQQMLKQKNQEIDEEKRKCKLLQNKLEMEFSKNKSSKEITTFDEALKNQMSEVSQYKQKLEEKQDEILRLKDIGTSYRRQIDSLNNQIKVEQLKAVSQMHQLQQKNSIKMQDKENELKTYKNLVQTLESKLQVAVKQNKTKDNFMVQHLTGKAKLGEQKQYISEFFRKYEVEFPNNRISEKLLEEQKEIQRLKTTIYELAGKTANY